MGQEIEGYGDEIAYFDGVAVRVRMATSADRKLMASREMGRQTNTAVIP